MKLVLTFCAILLASTVYAQNDTTKRYPSPPPVALQYNSSAIQVQAQFLGGAPGWLKYLQKNLRAKVAQKNIVLRKGQADSIQTVLISFLVDTAGHVSEVTVDNPTMVTPAVGAEALRVLQASPNWLPATINGDKMVYRQKQSISFQVTR